ncbi:hypothetical protein BDW22DRAFT_1424023 [Trametopsis cervina]|nr:hypothetical protein BDW22DRAFT_1424023 [Trametopsis cervina]
MQGDEYMFPPGPSRLRQIQDLDIEPHKRVASLSRRGNGKQRASVVPGANAEPLADFTSAPFSDEYDLSHEDPRILEDVQRALHLKARREARLKGTQNKKPPADQHFTSDQGSLSSFSTQASPIRAKVTDHQPTVQPGINSNDSEIDFSPSVGATPLHPVPSSSDGGATLDWTASSSEDERDKRWPLLAKRRTKDKSSVSANRTVVEKQESLYSDKLAHIKARVKPHTLRKAALTAEQLQRRYSVLLDPARPGTNLLSAVRWYNQQDSLVRTALDSAEPLTWLKHLLDKRAYPGSSRPPWHLTALAIEEYAKAAYPPLQSIPEDSELPSGPTPLVSQLGSSVASSAEKSTRQSGSSYPWSWSSPPLEPSLSRKRVDTEDGISFEPQIDSGRSSVGGDSRRSSFDFMNSRKQSLSHGAADSPGSSLRSGSVGAYGMSVTNGRVNFRDLASRVRRKPYERSEEALSSARNSISEHSHGEDMSPVKGRKRTRPTSLSRPIGIDPIVSDGEQGQDDGMGHNSDGALTARTEQGPMHSAEATVTASETPHTPPQDLRARPIDRLRPRRKSLPSLNQLLLREQEKQQLHATEEQERREYEHKLQMLEDTIEQNRRTRQLLQRIGAHVREYENVQSRLSDLLGTPYTSVPPEVLDAFSHDPASVISSTKRLKGWHAVEDIHARIALQRETLRNFASSLPRRGIGDGSDTALEDMLGTLSYSLDQLEEHRSRLSDDAEEVDEALVEVKEIHAGVKREYNEVMAHTSLIYPQLSQIVALEENYRNRYQQIWDIGLDALTLLLDTVTPVWRNYGKVIGEDVQDFLIVPWYRNEFTGEKQRYPITRLPRRSFRHWIGLLLFAFISVGFLLLQFNAAVSTTAYYNVPWIPNAGFRWLIIPFFIFGLFIQWISVLVECCIVLAEFVVVVWWLGWAIRIFH